MSVDPDKTLKGSAVWGEHEIAGEFHARIGPLDLRVRGEKGELWIASRLERSPFPQADFDSSDAWTRWATDGSVVLSILPALPDRPVVVAPETAFRLPPDARARIYVRVPVWVRIAFAGHDDLALHEAPTFIMSDTWWGDFGSGDLAYWLPTTARREITDNLFEPHLLMSPLELVNTSEEVLSVEKLAIRVTHMPVFREGTKLWSAETEVTYEAGEEGSRIEISDRPPPEAPRAELLTPPREPPVRGFRARTFGRFIALAPW